MKIALLGYGAMGTIVERLAVERAHEVGAIVDESDAKSSSGDLAKKLLGCDTAIDFTHGMAVRRNVEACVVAKVPVVVGTTGWHDQLNEIEEIVKKGSGALVYGANFSIGVNLFYRIAEYAASLLARFPEYEVFIEEQHHSRKKDAPSGTALKLRDVVEQSLNENGVLAAGLPISSTRAGNIPGTHHLGFDGPADQILLTHTARSREGFAHGAIAAAEWIVGKTGVFEFTDVVNETIGQNRGQ